MRFGTSASLLPNATPATDKPLVGVPLASWATQCRAVSRWNASAMNNAAVTSAVAKESVSTLALNLKRLVEIVPSVKCVDIERFVCVQKE